MRSPGSAPWQQPVTRRTFLRGAGISLALPWLESLPLRAADTGKVVASTVATKPPVRFACIYFSNGVEPIHWWAKGSGASTEIGPGLQPMAPVRGGIGFFSGLH